MTAKVSCNLPSLLYIFPDVRIMAGIDASTMTSEGTCRFVIPFSEFTIAKAGPFSMAWFMESSISDCKECPEIFA